MYELFVWKLIEPFEIFQIGVEGGVKELINHFENDVFGRQNELIQKCQHNQTIIDNYVERALGGCTVNLTMQNTKEDNLTSQMYKKKDENTVIKEKPTEIENTIEEVATDIEQPIEFNIDNMLIEPNSLMNTKFEHVEHAYFENPNFEFKNTETGKKNNNNKTMSKILNFDLLKPIVIEPINYEPESILYKTTENTTDIKMHNKRQNVFNNENVFNLEQFGEPNLADPPTESEWEHLKKKKMTELKSVHCLMESLCSKEPKKSIEQNLKIKKDLSDFDKDYHDYKASQGLNDLSDYLKLNNINSRIYDDYTFSHRKTIFNDGASTSKQNLVDQHISYLNDKDNGGPSTQYCSVIDGLLNKL